LYNLFIIIKILICIIRSSIAQLMIFASFAASTVYYRCTILTWSTLETLKFFRNVHPLGQVETRCGRNDVAVSALVKDLHVAKMNSIFSFFDNADNAMLTQRIKKRHIENHLIIDRTGQTPQGVSERASKTVTSREILYETSRNS
jgi:hypothetical protein